MKKILALVLAAMMLLCCVSCGGGSDLKLIKENGKMVIGITLYEPMNYYAEDGATLIGFDTEFAEALCAKLGVTPEFQIIDWDMKETELKSGNIDAIWNGLTVTEERNQNFRKQNTKNFVLLLQRRYHTRPHSSPRSTMPAQWFPDRS